MTREATGHSAGHDHRALAVVNGVINALISAAAGYGVALIHWKEFRIDWYHNPAEAYLEEHLVLGDLALGGVLTGAIASVVVLAIMYHQWDRAKVAPTESTALLIDGERSRAAHAAVTALLLGSMLGLFTLLNGVMYFSFTGLEEMPAETFAVAKVVAGAVAGFVAGWYATVSAAVNLSKGRLLDTSDQGNLIARTSLWSSQNARKVVAVVLLATLLFGSGVTKIHTNVDVADVLPRGDPHTEAAHNLTDRFKSSFTQQVTLQFAIDEAACLEDSRRNIPLRHGPNGQPTNEVNCGNITDEVYIRAIEEFFVFLQNYRLDPEDKYGIPEEDLDELPKSEREEIEEKLQSPIAYMVGLPSFYKLINWTIAGGQNGATDADFGLPDESNRADWNALHRTTWASIETTITPTLDPTHEQAAILFLVPAKSNFTSREIGEFVVEARDAYLEWAPQNADYKVFTGDNKPLFTVDLPVANAHGSELVEEDLSLLLPLVIYFIIICLFVAFRSVKSVAISGATMGLGVVWTYGLMGHMDIALNPLNLTVVPLIMGVGIDYSIHMINEFLEHKSEGKSDADAFRIAGERAGLAMFIATVTTVAGLAVMMVSPSLLLAQLGLLSAIAITSIYTLTISFIPAVLTLMKGTERMGAQFSPSRFMPAAGRFIHKYRAVFAVLVVAVTVGSYLSMANLGVEEFGEPGLNYPESDPFRQEHVAGLQGFYNSEPGEPSYKTNVVVVQGDITDPETHRYLDSLTAALRAEANKTDVINMDTSRNLPFLIRTWITVRDGPTGVPIGLISDELDSRGHSEYSQYPKTRAEIESTLDALFRSPLATFGSLFVDHPSNNITIITVAVKTGSFENAEEAWFALQGAVDAVEDERPRDVTVAFVGNTPTNYLFIQKELPWLNYMSYAAFIVVALLVFAFTRDLKATTAVCALVGLTSVWLLGALPLMGIGLAITLMLPLVFVFNIGSDFAVHLIWNIEKVGDANEVFGTVGKAVLFSAITTLGAFALFTPIPFTPLEGIRDLMVRKAMVATVAAIAIIFVASIVITSLLYRVAEDEDGEAPGSGGGAEPVDAPEPVAAEEAPGAPRVTIKDKA